MYDESTGHAGIHRHFKIYFEIWKTYVTNAKLI